ncbi:hypothetical protein M1558_00235 [Candidatus Parvarchaeota archaeon]|nr:hypothetical protein [Candidatus Parvarchaeota archaeon]
MKLEKLLDELEIPGYALDRDVREAIQEIAKKYSQDAQYLKDTVRGLVDIAINTKDKDAVIESAKTIIKYEGKTAEIIAYGLKDIAENTKDKDAVIESAKTILKYGENNADNIVYGLENIASITKDKNRVIKAARIMSLDEIANSVKNATYVGSLVKIAGYTEDKDAVIESLKMIMRYRGNNADNIAYGLKDIAGNTKDKNRVIKAARIMSLDEIVNYVKNADAYSLVKIAGYTEDKDAVIESAKTIIKYGDAADNIAYGLKDIAENTKDKDAVIESAKTILKYGRNNAENIAYGLKDIAIDTKDKGTLMAACRITNLVGADAFDILDIKDFFAIKNKKLDDLIGSKESFAWVAAYIKSGYELPIPSKDNITNYKNVASEYISKEYSIKNSNLNTNQILMLFSVDKGKRRELADLIDNSNEIALKMYNIATEETKRLEGDDKLPYLALIAVTGSRNKAVDNEAYKRISEIAGEKVIRKARNEFNSHYKNKIKELAEYIKKNEIDKAIDSLKSTKNEAIGDVLRFTDYKDFGFTGGNTILRAVENNNPLDYDNRTQIACVYLPSNYHDGIYNYCKDYYSRDKDKGFVLVKYALGNKSLGSAICYMEDNTFLVDSVEGHRTFRKPQIFKAVYKDLLERAKEKGAKTVIFSENGINETPKKFIEFLGDLGIKKGYVNMKLNTNGYLEAKNGVMGYVINLN